MGPTMPFDPKAIDRYTLHEVGDSVVVKLNTVNASAVLLQVVTSGEASLEVSADSGFSWVPVSVRLLGSDEFVESVQSGEIGWVEAPGLTTVRAVLRRKGSVPCKVNLRYGQR
jgi:hypothetical protein